MTATTDFLTPYAEGFAQLIAARVDPGLNVAWQASGNYAAGKKGIYIANVPTSPDVIITLTPIPVGGNPLHTSADVDLQVRFRATPDIRDLWTVRDAVRAALAGRFPITLPTGIYVSSLQFGYGAPLGQDDQAKRWMWADLWHTSAADPR